MKSLRVATCQFSVEGRIEHNRRWVLKQIAQAAEQNIGDPGLLNEAHVRTRRRAPAPEPVARIAEAERDRVAPARPIGAGIGIGDGCEMADEVEFEAECAVSCAAARIVASSSARTAVNSSSGG